LAIIFTKGNYLSIFEDKNDGSPVFKTANHFNSLHRPSSFANRFRIPGRKAFGVFGFLSAFVSPRICSATVNLCRIAIPPLPVRRVLSLLADKPDALNPEYSRPQALTAEPSDNLTALCPAIAFPSRQWPDFHCQSRHSEVRPHMLALVAP